MSAEQDLLVVACAISAGVHAALTPSHFDGGARLGIGFLIASALLAGLVVALRRNPGPRELSLTVLVLAGLLAGYVLTITSGLPVLHPEREPVNGLALATKLVETAALLAALDLMRHGRPAVAINLSPKGTAA